MAVSLCPALAELLPVVPAQAGVYLFKDSRGEVLYVGKAVNLKNRLASYLRETGSPRIAALLQRVAQVEFLVTNTEREALILERNLIREHRPRYNVNLRDDKNFLCLRLDLQEPAPRLTLVRRFAADGARYFGPYPSSAAVRELVKFMKRTFRLRSCKDRGVPKRSRPCLYYQIGQCLAPCCGLVSLEEYRQTAREAVLFLQGQGKQLRQELTRRMQEAAADLRFEEAARLRDRLALLERTLAQQVVQLPTLENTDVIGLAREEAAAAVVVLLVRGGQVTGSLPFFFPEVWQSDADFLAAFLKQFYQGEQLVPPLILVPQALPEMTAWLELLQENRDYRIRLLTPRQGPRQKLLALAAENARRVLEKELALGPRPDPALDLQAHLQLPRPPRRLACLDISNLQDKAAVGALVVFQDGQPDKAGYRRFNLAEIAGPNDPAMLAAVVRRQFAEPETPLPELLVVDGGPGQLAAVSRALADLGLQEQLPVVALAKATVLRTGETIRDRLYLPGRKNPKFLPPSSPGWLLLLRLRDEAHRFALAYHRRCSRRQALQSVLTQVPGLGPKRRRLLLQHFPDLTSLAQADPAELQRIARLPAKVATAVVELLRGTNNSERQSAPPSGRSGAVAADSSARPAETRPPGNPATGSQ